MEVRYLTGMEISASGLAALRKQMDVVAENLANMHTTRTESGDPYRRKQVEFEAAIRRQVLPAGEAFVQAPLLHTHEVHYPNGQRLHLPQTVEEQRVAFAVGDDPSEFPIVYDPTHPHADAEGRVRLPNVDMAQELVQLMTAARAYEANIAALQTARMIADAGLDLAR